MTTDENGLPEVCLVSGRAIETVTGQLRLRFEVYAEDGLPLGRRVWVQVHLVDVENPSIFFNEDFSLDDGVRDGWVNLLDNKGTYFIERLVSETNRLHMAGERYKIAFGLFYLDAPNKYPPYQNLKLSHHIRIEPNGRKIVGTFKLDEESRLAQDDKPEVEQPGTPAAPEDNTPPTPEVPEVPVDPAPPKEEPPVISPPEPEPEVPAEPPKAGPAFTVLPISFGSFSNGGALRYFVRIEGDTLPPDGVWVGVRFMPTRKGGSAHSEDFNPNAAVFGYGNEGRVMEFERMSTSPFDKGAEYEVGVTLYHTDQQGYPVYDGNVKAGEGVTQRGKVFQVGRITIPGEPDDNSKRRPPAEPHAVQKATPEKGEAAAAPSMTRKVREHASFTGFTDARTRVFQNSARKYRLAPLPVHDNLDGLTDRDFQSDAGPARGVALLVPKALMGAIEDGTVFGLNPKVDVATLKLQPETAKLAKAIQAYGARVVGTTPNHVGFYVRQGDAYKKLASDVKGLEKLHTMLVAVDDAL